MDVSSESTMFLFFRFDPLHTKENTCDKNIMIFFIGTNLSFKNSLWHKGFFFYILFE